MNEAQNISCAKASETLKSLTIEVDVFISSL